MCSEVVRKETYGYAGSQFFFLDNRPLSRRSVPCTSVCRPSWSRRGTAHPGVDIFLACDASPSRFFKRGEQPRYSESSGLKKPCRRLASTAIPGHGVRSARSLPAQIRLCVATQQRPRLQPRHGHHTRRFACISLGLHRTQPQSRSVWTRCQ